MRKALYIILLLVELVVSFLLMSLAWTNMGWIPCVIIIALWAALLVWQIVKLKNNSDAEKVRKIKRNIAWIMLIPSASYVVMILWLMIILLSVI